MAALLEVKNLRTIFRLFKGPVTAVDDVSFTLEEGEILGLVGESGGGKSVTGFSLLGLVDPPGAVTGGSVLFRGEDLLKKSEEEMRSIRGKEISMVFQDPMTSLNPLHTVGAQIDEALRLHTPLGGAERRARGIELLEEVGIPCPTERLNNYPHQFSGGMRQRIVIAIALAARPALVVADEPTTALDVTVQAQILRLMEGLVQKNRSALILITHDLAVVAGTAHRVAVMYCGRIVEEGATDAVVRSPLHPYTRGLLDSIPKRGERVDRLRQIRGMIPNPHDMPSGCAFAPRCDEAMDVCRVKRPEPCLVGGSRVACHKWTGGF